MIEEVVAKTEATTSSKDLNEPTFNVTDVVGSNAEHAAGMKRKTRGSIDIGEKFNNLLKVKEYINKIFDAEIVRRSSRNKPQAIEDSPSGSTIPLPSISTPEPSSNNSPTDEWGTGVPSGALFKSNPKSSVKDEEKGDEDNDEDSKSTTASIDST